MRDLIECCLGIEIGGSKLQIVVGSGDGAIRNRRRFAVDPVEGGFGIRSRISECLAELKDEMRFAAVGVGFGGPIDRTSGRICCSHQIEGWSDFALRDWLESLAEVDVRVENDANTAAFGEARCGAGMGNDPIFYVTLGSGVGGGLVVGGEIYHGASPGEAEIGHVRLNMEGATVESRCSGWAVDQQIRQLCQAHPESLLTRLILNQKGAEAIHLSAAFEQDDELAKRILDEAARNLAFGLSHVTHLFHPEVVILGGGLSKVGEPLRAAVQQHLASFIMGAFQPGPKVRLAVLGEDAVPVGALLLAGKSLMPPRQKE